MTITEKILAWHCRKKQVRAGDFIWAGVDLCLGNDITAPLAIAELERSGIRPINRNKIVLVSDHFLPAKDKRSANQAKILSRFAAKYKIRHYYDVGQMGVEHALLPELGLVGPGDLIVGADSHTCTYGALGAFSTGMGSCDLAGCWASGRVWLKVPQTIKFVYKGRLRKWVGGKDLILYTIANIGVAGALYKAMEFSGEVIRRLPMDGRLTMCNMAIEAGAKNGIIAPDKTTLAYFNDGRRHRLSSRRSGRSSSFVSLSSDPDAQYEKVYTWDVSRLEPQVACPHLPGNVRAVGALKGIKLDQVVIGSCTNGRISDLRLAAKVLRGRRIARGLRCIVIPATQNIYLQAIKEGLIKIFVEAGAVVVTPTCGPCLGGHSGILAEGEACLATTNRNFVGRMGALKSRIYLSNPALAAASAIRGKITHPAEIGVRD